MALDVELAGLLLSVDAVRSMQRAKLAIERPGEFRVPALRPGRQLRLWRLQLQRSLRHWQRGVWRELGGVA